MSQVKYIDDAEAAELAVQQIKNHSELTISCEGLVDRADEPIVLFQASTFKLACFLQ